MGAGSRSRRSNKKRTVTNRTQVGASTPTNSAVPAYAGAQALAAEAAANQAATNVFQTTPAPKVVKERDKEPVFTAPVSPQSAAPVSSTIPLTGTSPIVPGYQGPAQAAPITVARPLSATGPLTTTVPGTQVSGPLNMTFAARPTQTQVQNFRATSQPAQQGFDQGFVRNMTGGSPYTGDTPIPVFTGSVPKFANNDKYYGPYRGDTVPSSLQRPDTGGVPEYLARPVSGAQSSFAGNRLAGYRDIFGRTAQQLGMSAPVDNTPGQIPSRNARPYVAPGYSGASATPPQLFNPSRPESLYAQGQRGDNSREDREMLKSRTRFTTPYGDMFYSAPQTNQLNPKTPIGATGVISDTLKYRGTVTTTDLYNPKTLRGFTFTPIGPKPAPVADRRYDAIERIRLNRGAPSDNLSEAPAVIPTYTGGGGGGGYGGGGGGGYYPSDYGSRFQQNLMAWRI